MSEAKRAPDTGSAAEPNPVYLFTTPEIEEALTDYGTSLEELLRMEGVDAEVLRGANPARQEGGAEKEVVSIILASSALALALTPILTRALNRVARKPLVLEKMVLRPVVGPSGEVVKDASGQPLTYWETQHEVVEEKAAAPPESLALGIEALGFKLSYREN